MYCFEVICNIWINFFRLICQGRLLLMAGSKKGTLLMSRSVPLPIISLIFEKSCKPGIGPMVLPIQYL